MKAISKKILLKIILFIFGFFFSTNAFSQVPLYSWIKVIKGDGTETGKIATDSKGSVYITGTYNSTGLNFGTITLPNNGGNDIFIARYDTAGNVIWAKQFGGTGNDFCSSVTTAGNGDILICGSFENSISFDATTLISNGGADVFYARINSSGNVIWAKKAGGTADDIATDFSIDGSGNMYICGEFISTSFTFDGQVLTTGSLKGLFYGKLDPNGNKVWMKSVTGSGASTTNSFFYIDGIRRIDNDSVLITGRLRGNPGLNFNPNPTGIDPFGLSSGSGVPNPYLVKLTSNGTYFGQGVINNNSRLVQYGFYIKNSKFISAGQQQNLSGFWADAFLLATNIHAPLPGLGTQINFPINSFYSTNGYWPATYHFDYFSSVVQDYYNNTYSVGVHEDETNAANPYSTFTLATSNASIQLIDMASNTQSPGVRGEGTSIVLDTNKNVLYIAGIYRGATAFNILNTTLPANPGGDDIFFMKGQLNHRPSPPMLVDAGGDKNISSGQSVILGASVSASGGTAPLSYSWSPSANLNSATIPNPTATPSVTTSYILTVTDEFGQVVTDTVVVNVAVLPVTLLNFYGQPFNNTKVLLNWKVAAEYNINKYEVLRSNNGRDFLKIGEVQSTNSLVEKLYSFIDDNPLKGINYYKLRIVDLNPSNTKYSNVTAVIFDDKQLQQFTLLPNPATANFVVNFKSGIKGKLKIELFNAVGQLVYTETFIVNNETSKIIKRPAGMASGDYLLKVTEVEAQKSQILKLVFN